MVVSIFIFFLDSFYLNKETRIQIKKKQEWRNIDRQREKRKRFNYFGSNLSTVLPVTPLSEATIGVSMHLQQGSVVKSTIKLPVSAFKSDFVVFLLKIRNSLNNFKTTQ